MVRGSCQRQHQTGDCSNEHSAFERDAEMIRTAEEAFTRFFDRPLKFGAMRIDAAGEEWRFVRPWPRMIADYINRFNHESHRV